LIVYSNIFRILAIQFNFHNGCTCDSFLFLSVFMRFKISYNVHSSAWENKSKWRIIISRKFLLLYDILFWIITVLCYNKMIEIKRGSYVEMKLTWQAWLYRAREKCINIQLQLNFDKMLIFNISILKQATFKIVYICFSVSTLLFNYYKITNIIKKYNLYQEERICDLFFISIISFSLI